MYAETDFIWPYIRVCDTERIRLDEDTFHALAISVAALAKYRSTGHHLFRTYLKIIP